MEPVDVTSSIYIDSSKELIIKNLKLKLVILLEYQNINIFLQKITLQIALKKLLWLKKLKTLSHGHMLLMILIKKKLLGNSTKKNCKIQFKKSLEKVIKRKDDKLYVKWKEYNNSLNSWIDKNT